MEDAKKDEKDESVKNDKSIKVDAPSEPDKSVATPLGSNAPSIGQLNKTQNSAIMSKVGSKANKSKDEDDEDDLFGGEDFGMNSDDKDEILVKIEDLQK
jgi:hypothetical protein